MAIATVYFIFDPLEYSWMPQCVFHRITGLECVGCGSQRMLHSLLHGDIAGAWEANAFALLSLPAVVFLGWVELNRTKRPLLYSKVYSTTLIIITGIAMTLWFIIRNL